MELFGEEVKHKVFGRGTITEFKNDYIMVLFEESKAEKKFSYPSVFGTFLELDNKILFEQVESENAQILIEKRKALESRELLARSIKAMDDEALRLKKSKSKSKASKLPKGTDKH